MVDDGRIALRPARAFGGSHLAGLYEKSEDYILKAGAKFRSVNAHVQYITSSLKFTALTQMLCDNVTESLSATEYNQVKKTKQEQLYFPKQPRLAEKGSNKYGGS